jgi:hypothetical protein
LKPPDGSPRPGNGPPPPAGRPPAAVRADHGQGCEHGIRCGRYVNRHGNHSRLMELDESVASRSLERLGQVGGLADRCVSARSKTHSRKFHGADRHRPTGLGNGCDAAARGASLDLRFHVTYGSARSWVRVPDIASPSGWPRGR